MATIIDGDLDVFRAMTYARPAQTVSHRIEHDYQRATSMGLLDQGMHMLQRARQAYEQLMDNDPWRIAKAAIRRVESLWGSDEIRNLVEFHDIQNAKPIMQRWIMANETIRKLYHEQRCDGYQGSYIDTQPGYVGKQHHDWCTLHEGVVKMSEDNDDWSASTISWTDQDNTELTLAEKMLIMETHEHAEAGVRAGKDVTSSWDDDL